MRCWDSNSAARPDAKDLLGDVLDLRLANEASPVQDDAGVEVVAEGKGEAAVAAVLLVHLGEQRRHDRHQRRHQMPMPMHSRTVPCALTSSESRT